MTDHGPTDHTDDPRRRDPDEARDEYSDVDPETVVDDALGYFAEEPGPADSPASDADAPAPPG